ncbi:MAG: hypothetical protein ACKVVO_17520, partial [Opitutaceae bacterium]
MKFSPHAALLILVSTTCFVVQADAQEWTRFRGPNGTGISTAKGVPVTWAENGFAWRVPIAGASHSQPVAWGDRLFLLTALDNGNERAIICVRKSDGKELWQKSYPLPMAR